MYKPKSNLKQIKSVVRKGNAFFVSINKIVDKRKKGVKLWAQNLLLFNLIKLFFMSVIIICLICAALVFGVEYFERRHMRLFKLKAELQSGEDIASAVDQVYYGGKAKDKSEAEQLRTRKIKYVLWALIVFLGVASIVFVNFKDQWLGEWKSFFSSESKVETEVPATEVDDYSLSIWDYFATYFSSQKAMRYDLRQKQADYQDALAEYRECEQALKQAQQKQDSEGITIHKAYLDEAKAKVDRIKKDLDSFKYVPSDWKKYVNLNWLLLILFLVNGFILYSVAKDDDNWRSIAGILSLLAVIVGVAWPFAVFLSFQGDMIFGLRDVIGIILTLLSLCYFFIFIEN